MSYSQELKSSRKGPGGGIWLQSRKGRASLVAQMVKNLPAMPETWVWALGWEDLLEEGMATCSRFLPGKSRGQRSLMHYSPWGRKESDTTEQLSKLGSESDDISSKLGDGSFREVGERIVWTLQWNARTFTASSRSSEIEGRMGKKRVTISHGYSTLVLPRWCQW